MYSNQAGEKHKDILNPEGTKFTNEFCTYFSSNKNLSYPKGLTSWPYHKNCSVEGQTQKSVHFYTEHGPIDDVILKGLEKQIQNTFKREAAGILKGLLKLKEKFP